ncbi:Hypp6651 [Branchiostoma lanceolatum]|uniref:Hypp6651 protein n=1 Tax=Branchiostoma lanceolatum TaxID=7740 RepID=A0A8J9YVB8_BRALA|nr:Hypp6651 [Branchiostoma lanceolatum]
MGMDVSDTLVSSRSQEAESTVPSSRRLSFSKSEKERLNSEKETQKRESILVEEGYYVRCQVEGADYVPCRQPITNPGAEKKLLDFLHKTVVYKKAENYIHEDELELHLRDPETVEAEEQRFEEEAEKARASIGGHGRGQPTTPGALPARYHHVAPGVPTSATGLHLWWGARTPPGQEATKGTTHEIWRPNPRGDGQVRGRCYNCNQEAYSSGDDEDWSLLNLANRPTADVGVDDLFEDKP